MIMPAAEANNPQGTGPISIDDAVDALMRPLTRPSRSNNGAAPATTTPEDAASPPDDEDDEGAAPTGTDRADTDDSSADATAENADGEAPETSDKPDPGPTYEVEIDGEKQAITLPELLAGYQRQAVFTKRSQSLAEDRRAFESERNGIQQERSRYAVLLSALEAQIVNDGGVEPNWDALRAADPVRFSVEWADWQQRREKLGQIAAEKQKLAHVAQTEQTHALRDHVMEQGRLLIEKIPEYRDEAYRRQERDAIRDFAVKTYGFSQDEISSLIDHRAVLALRDARAYRDLQGKKAVVEKRVVDQGAPLSRNRGVPTGTPQVRIKTANERLNRTGKLQDAVELELARSRARQSHGNGSGGS
jgi:hypothetical protein